MFSIRYFLLCLVALSTSIVSALPITPSSSTFHDLHRSKTPTGTISLVSRQEGNPQRQLFCRYNPADCQRDFPEYCTDMTKPSPEWCDVVPTNVARLDARSSDVSADDHSLVPRQESQEDILKKQLNFCRENTRYCEDLCDAGSYDVCDQVTCRIDPSRCRNLYPSRCTKWGGSMVVRPQGHSTGRRREHDQHHRTQVPRRFQKAGPRGA